MTGKLFVDTNVLVYAHDASAGRKHEIARSLLENLWRNRSGVVSTQVLQELYVNVRRIAVNPMKPGAARQLIEDYMAWQVVVNDAQAIIEAIKFEKRYRISFWDALIVQAANAADVGALLTEDLNHGQRYGEVQAVNPFFERAGSDSVHES